MSEILSIAQRSKSILADTSIEPPKRVWQSMKALSGLVLSDLSPSAKEIVESEVGRVNGILGNYQIDTFEDYDHIEGDDLDEIMERIETVTTALVDTEIERVMTGLKSPGRKLPRVEIEDVRQHKELFIPLLINSIDQAIAAVRADNDPEGDTHFFAAFLLTEFEVHAAFPVMLEGFLLHRDVLYGDAVHEFFPSLLALFLKEDTAKLEEIVQNTSLDMYVRWAAATTYMNWVRDGVMTRDEVVAKLHANLRRSLESGDHELVGPFICLLADLAAHEALDTIRDAFERDLVDPFLVDLEGVEASIDAGDAEVQKSLHRRRPTGMPDTIAELSKWAAFSEQPGRVAKKPALQNPVSHLPRAANVQEKKMPVAGADAKVGRNDPCPCGSGKKFKKCCLSKAVLEPK